MPSSKASPAKKNFDIPAGDAFTTLKRFFAQSGEQLVYKADSLEGVKTSAIKGEFTPPEALRRMLSHTHLVVKEDAKTGALAVVPAARPGGPNGSAHPTPNASASAQKKTEIMKPTRNPVAVLAAWLAFVFAPAHAAVPGQSPADTTGSITGRILNEATSQYLRNASVTIAGTNLSTVAEAGGTYTLTGVPAGRMRVVVSYAGLDNAEAFVTVSAGQTTVRDFTMSSQADGAVVMLGEYRVVTEREGNYKAIQDQKAALEIKSVIASDAFGDVSEGNVGEFLKLMPGVMMDYVDADIRAVSIGGLDPKYAVVMMDGAPVASASSSNINTGRAFEFEQLSISSIEMVELSKTPTPDVSGSALAGVVNLRSKGAFDRKGRQVRWSVSSQLNSHHLSLKKTAGPGDTKGYKLQPNYSLEFSDVFREGRLGVLAGHSFSRTLVEQNLVLYSYRFDADETNNRTEVPPLSLVRLVDAPKVTDRSNYNLRLDYKVSPALMVWARGDYNTYEARNFQRNLTLGFGNTINGPSPTDPRVAGVEYSLRSQTTTLGSAQHHKNLTFVKHGTTRTFSSGAAFKRGGFRADAQAQVSISTNFLDDLPYGFFNTGTTGTISNLTLRLDRASASDPAFNITQRDGLDWRDPASYTAPARPTARQPIKGKDQKWTAKMDFRYDWRRWAAPVLLKWGGDISQQIRDVRRESNLTYTYLGPDGRANTGDEGWKFEPHYRLRNLAGGNVQNLPSVDIFSLAREYGAHPERFVPPTPQDLLNGALRNHWDVKEQIDSLYAQTIIKVTPKFDIAPGVRLEKVRSAGRGPTDRGDDYAKEKLTGNPQANIPTNSLDYIQARYGSDAINESNYHTWLKYLHATYRPTNNLALRASFNDSITRPNLSDLAGGVAINSEVVPPSARIANPALKPEHGRNVFASVEYYFPKGAGFFTVSGSRRDISNLIRNTTFLVPEGGNFAEGTGLDLGGHRVTTTDNLGKAHVGSLEFSYRQNMVFLPGIWKRFSVFGNYTVLKFDDYENFYRPDNLANGGLSFDHRGFSLRWNVVWVPIHKSYDQGDGWENMVGERTMHDAQFSFRLWKSVTLFVTARNIFNHNQQEIWGPARSDIIARNSDYGSVWTVGFRGQF